MFNVFSIVVGEWILLIPGMSYADVSSAVGEWSC